MQIIQSNAVSSIDGQSAKNNHSWLLSKENDVEASSQLVGLVQGAALDLIKGHLPDKQYTPATRGFGEELRGWFVPTVDYEPQKENHFVAKIQTFESGGYEVTITEQNLHDLAECMDRERAGGKREKCEQKENDVVSSMARSKKKVRLLIKSMGCDRLLTLTRREIEVEEFWTKEQWGEAWDKFIRLCKKAGVTIQYVAVLEAHKKGNYHLHAAIVGRLNVKIARGIWLACTGGKGTGNVDVQMRQNCTVHQRRAGLAKYVSKYITKQADLVEFNKKRYWSSKHKLPEPRRYILNGGDLLEALSELLNNLGLDVFKVMRTAFIFPTSPGFESKGLWFAFDDDLLKPIPF